MSMVKAVLQLEGAVVLAASIWFYFFQVNGGWALFAVLILAPDLSMIGFVKDTRLGSITYNLMHNYILSVVAIIIGVATDTDLVTLLGLILSAHVGMDRALTYGLKYASDFKDTHMQRV